MRRAFMLCLAAASLGGQTPPGNIIPIGLRGGIPPVLRNHLELTAEQTDRIDRLNNSLRQFETTKFARSSQVQAEITDETAREPLDPMALGLRYTELEAIRRETEAERNRTVDAVQSVLATAQRTKLAALQDVLRTHALACEALINNLLSPLPPKAPDPADGIAALLLGSTGGCPIVGGGTVSRVVPLRP